MTNVLLYIKEIWRGKDLYRIFMNIECSKCVLLGKTADIGSGTGRASYHRFFSSESGAKILMLDRQISPVDFERDRLPYPDANIDTLLAFNVFEHIYNYSFLVSEIKRVLKPGGRVYGAVPFLVGFHPDPDDFWRYTSSALETIFQSNGFNNIEIKVLGRGPFTAGFSQIEFMLPRIFKIIILPAILFLDCLIFFLKTKLNSEKFALGFFFTLR